MNHFSTKTGIARFGKKTQRMFLLIALISFIGINCVNAQSNRTRNGFIGISIGPAIPMGSFIKDNCNTGIQFNADFGYLFTENIGIHAEVFGTTFSSKYNDNSIGLTGVLVGPLFSTLSGEVEFDFKPGVGFANGRLNIKNQGSSSSKTTFSFGGAASVRWNLWEKFSLSGNVMYCYGKPKDDDNIIVDLSSLAVMVGVNYRLK